MTDQEPRPSGAPRIDPRPKHPAADPAAPPSARPPVSDPPPASVVWGRGAKPEDDPAPQSAIPGQGKMTLRGAYVTIALTIFLTGMEFWLQTSASLRNAIFDE